MALSARVMAAFCDDRGRFLVSSDGGDVATAEGPLSSAALWYAAPKDDDAAHRTSRRLLIMSVASRRLLAASLRGAPVSTVAGAASDVSLVWHMTAANDGVVSLTPAANGANGAVLSTAKWRLIRQAGFGSMPRKLVLRVASSGRRVALWYSSEGAGSAGWLSVSSGGGLGGGLGSLIALAIGAPGVELQPQLSPAALFVASDAGDGRFALKSAKNDRWLTIDPRGRAAADKTERAGWESFAPLPGTGLAVALATDHRGMYLGGRVASNGRVVIEGVPGPAAAAALWLIYDADVLARAHVKDDPLQQVAALAAQLSRGSPPSMAAAARASVAPSSPAVAGAGSRADPVSVPIIAALSRLTVTGRPPVRAVTIFHDSENLPLPRDARHDANAVRSALLHWACDGAPMPHPPPRLTWNYFFAAGGSQSQRVEEDLRIVNAVMIAAGTKRGNVDVQLKTRIAEFVAQQLHVVAAARAAHVVIIASGDCDFSPEVRSLRDEGLRVAVLANTHARSAFVKSADFHGVWENVVAGGGDPRSPLSPTSHASSARVGGAATAAGVGGKASGGGGEPGLCKHWAAGSCRHGDACRYQHVTARGGGSGGEGGRGVGGSGGGGGGSRSGGAADRPPAERAWCDAIVGRMRREHLVDVGVPTADLGQLAKPLRPGGPAGDALRLEACLRRDPRFEVWEDERDGYVRLLP